MKLIRNADLIDCKVELSSTHNTHKSQERSFTLIFFKFNQPTK